MERRGRLGAIDTRDGSEGGNRSKLHHGELLKTKIIAHLQKGWIWVAAAKMKGRCG
jgi:hypothetical protein